jgi:hypothetical protein
MADKRTTAPEGAPQAAPEEPRGKKRAGPTIDLTATEVPQSDPPGETPPEPPATASEPPPEQGEGAAAAAPAASPQAAFGIATLAAGAAGGAIVLIVLAALWFSGLLPLQLAASNEKSAQAAANSQAIDALDRRVSALEDAIKKLPPSDAGLADRLTAAENAMKSLGVALAALNSRSDQTATTAAQARERADAAAKAVSDLQEATKTAAPGGASQADVDALGKRVAALESAAQAARADIDKIAAGASNANDTAARLALSADVLRDAVAVGAPFADELAAVKELGGDAKALAPLAPFAASGVPTAQVLAQELKALLPAMAKLAGAQAPQGGFLDRLQANASKLVHIRPVNAPEGDDTAAVLARLDIDAAKADLKAALADLGKLDAAARAPAETWITKVQAREAALAAARRYAAETARALGQKAGTQ